MSVHPLTYVVHIVICRVPENRVFGYLLPEETHPRNATLNTNCIIFFSIFDYYSMSCSMLRHITLWKIIKNGQKMKKTQTYPGSQTYPGLQLGSITIKHQPSNSFPPLLLSVLRSFNAPPLPLSWFSLLKLL